MYEKTLSHLHALELHLSNERVRLAQASSAQEREIRSVWVTQLEREIEGEKQFLGITGTLPALSDDEILRELEG